MLPAQDHLVEPFEIEMKPLGRLSLVKFKVEILYHSDAVIRFRLKGGIKILDMEKNKLESDQFKAWKILTLNFAPEYTEAAAWNLTEIRMIIEEKITGVSRNKYRPGQRIDYENKSNMYLQNIFPV